MADVIFTDGDVVFEDEDVIFDKLGTSLEVQNVSHGITGDVVAEFSQTELTALDSVHRVANTSIALQALPSQISDVYWQDGDVLFQDEDTEFVPRVEDAFDTQEPEHGLVSTNCSLTLQTSLNVVSPTHEFFSVNQNATLNGGVSVTDAVHDISGTHLVMDTSKTLAVQDASHCLFANNQDTTILTGLSVSGAIHKIYSARTEIGRASCRERVLS